MTPANNGVNNRTIIYGRAVAYVCQGDSLCVRPPTAADDVRLPLSGAWTWSPRGETLALFSGRAIRFVHPDGSAAGSSVPVPAKAVQDLAWSRSGELAFVARIGYSTRVWTMRRDGSRLHPVTPSATSRGGAGIDHLTWSADGARLAYDLQQGNAVSTWILNLHTGRRRRLNGAVGARFSPIGQRLMFQRWRGSRLELYVRAGGKDRRLASNAWSPVWSPDGMWIAYYNGKHGIKGIRVDGTRSSTLIGEARLPGKGEPASLVSWIIAR